MKVDTAKIVPLRGSPIFYLDKEHLSNNANVTLISQNDEKLKVNHLQLAIFNCFQNLVGTPIYGGHSNLLSLVGIGLRWWPKLGKDLSPCP